MRIRSSAKRLVLGLLPPALAACSGGPNLREISDSPVKIGAPYSVRGATYVPADDPDYDAVGYASWYGGAHEGKPTARGEPFRKFSISGAHRTLPLPSYVEVTALETGRTILLRINDRGPFVAGRIIDLSEGAAEQLGVKAAGVAAVRVRRVDPREGEKQRLRQGKRVDRPSASLREIAGLREKLERGGGLTSSRQPPPQSALLYVQVASFSEKSNASRLALRLGASLRSTGPGYWQVLLGPYSSAVDAREGVEAARRAGYSDAMILNR